MNKTALLYAATAFSYTIVGLVAIVRFTSTWRQGRLEKVSKTSSIVNNLNSSELAIGCACLMAALWAATFVLFDDHLIANVAELFQTTGWLAALLVIEHEFNGKIRGLGWQLRLMVLGFGLISSVLISLLHLNVVLLGEFSVDVRFILAVSTLVLIENIYRNAAEAARWHLNLPCIVISSMSVYTLLLYGDAVLHRHLSIGLLDGRAIAWIMLAPLIVIGGGRQRRWRRSLSLSRSAAFYTTTLVLSGAFLVGLGAAGEVFRSYGSGWGLLAEVALLFIGFVILAIFLTSGSARSYVRILVLDHFFTHRYDYQREWMRCLDTLGATNIVRLEQRVICVLADTVDAPAGVLFLRDGIGPGAAFVIAGLWNWPEPDAMIGPDVSFIRYLIASGGISRAIKDQTPWLATFPAAWLAVALPNPEVSDSPIGVVFLAPPRAAFVPDREVFDLLRVAAREISLVLAERQAAEALAHARRFEEAGKRFAFVAHDIKNVSSQLALLLSNASDHMENPEFRQDMLATLRASVDKINVMLTRLKAPYADARGALLPGQRLAVIAASAHKAGPVPVLFETDEGNGAIAVEDSVFDAVIGHLLDNAIDASATGAPVRLRLHHEPEQISIEVEDHGVGMNAAFVRDTLFRPFASSKPGGFGLGAFQARELVRAAGGELAVESAPGRGTTMRITLPRIKPSSSHSASEGAASHG